MVDEDGAPVERVAAQEPTADLTVAVRQFHAPLVRRLTMVVGDADEAEDLAQATYATAIESWASFDGKDLRAWLFTIGIRKAIDEVRRRQRHRRFWLRQPPPPLSAEADVELWSVLQTLDRAHRAALLLNVLDGYTHVEIADMFGVQPGTIASRISRAKQKLRAELRSEGSSGD